MYWLSNYFNQHHKKNNDRKHTTRGLFKIVVLGGMFSWKIVGVLVKFEKGSPGKSELFLRILRNKLEEILLENRSCSSCQYYATFFFVFFLLENWILSPGKGKFCKFYLPEPADELFLIFSKIFSKNASNFSRRDKIWTGQFSRNKKHLERMWRTE